MPDKILAISAHPDDETLGCGGSLLRHRAQGDELHWLILTKAHPPRWSPEIIAAKAEEVKKVGEAYGMKSVHWLDHPTAHLEEIAIDKLIADIGGVVGKVRPRVIYLVHGGDVHTDHQVVFKAALSALRPPSMRQNGVRRILCYETMSSTEAAPPLGGKAFLPNVFFDITGLLPAKLDIMGLYQSEIQADPLPRGPNAIQALARLRGATIGVEYAEAFMLLREVI